MHNRLLGLMAKNRSRGTFRADASSNVIELYDLIVGSDSEAEWFGGVSPQAFRRALGGMTGPVSLRINSPGGDVFGARAIEQAMREYGSPITAHVDGYAASAASLVTASASRVIMAPGSMLMIHKSWSFGFGNADDMLKLAELLEKVDGTIAETYAAKSGKDAATFAAPMAAETWYTAQEAVDIGLADEIAANGGSTQASKAWDLSAYARGPLPVSDELPAAPSPEPSAEDRARRLAARLRLPSA
jgi:ATP-dependent Clp protease, protease subunit